MLLKVEQILGHSSDFVNYRSKVSHEWTKKYIIIPYDLRGLFRLRNAETI